MQSTMESLAGHIAELEIALRSNAGAFAEITPADREADGEGIAKATLERERAEACQAKAKEIFNAYGTMQRGASEFLRSAGDNPYTAAFVEVAQEINVALGYTTNEAAVSREVGFYLKSYRANVVVQKRAERLIGQVSAVASSLIRHKVRSADLPSITDLDAELNAWQASRLALRTAWNAIPDEDRFGLAAPPDEV